MTNENNHINFDRNEKITVEILEGTNQFFKVPIHGKIPPIRLTFEYPEGSSKKNDLTVCFSRKNKQPGVTTSEKTFHRPQVALFESVDPAYLQAYLYIGLYSDFGCTLSMRATFPKDDLKNYMATSRGIEDPSDPTKGPRTMRSNKQMQNFRLKIDKKVKEIYEDTTKKALDEFNLEQAELKKAYKERIQQASGHEQIEDYLMKNKYVAREWDAIREEQMQQRQYLSYER